MIEVRCRREEFRIWFQWIHESYDRKVDGMFYSNIKYIILYFICRNVEFFIVTSVQNNMKKALTVSYLFQVWSLQQEAVWGLCSELGDMLLGAHRISFTNWGGEYDKNSDFIVFFCSLLTRICWLNSMTGGWNRPPPPIGRPLYAAPCFLIGFHSRNLLINIRSVSEFVTLFKW